MKRSSTYSLKIQGMELDPDLRGGDGCGENKELIGMLLNMLIKWHIQTGLRKYASIFCLNLVK